MNAVHRPWGALVARGGKLWVGAVAVELSPMRRVPCAGFAALFKTACTSQMRALYWSLGSISRFAAKSRVDVSLNMILER